MNPLAGEMLCTEVVPGIHASFPISIKTIGAEDHAELIQDTIAQAAAMLHRAGPTLGLAATKLGTGQIKVVAQDAHQAAFTVGIDRHGFAVHLQFRHF
jgi:hypothetical protein